MKPLILNIDRLLGELEVECIDNWGVERRLTLGKRYRVIETRGLGLEGRSSTYRIKADTNRTQLFSSGFFKIVPIPSKK